MWDARPTRRRRQAAPRKCYRNELPVRCAPCASSGISARGILGMDAERTSCLVCLSFWILRVASFAGMSGLIGCNSIIGLDQFSIAGGAGGSASTGTASGGGAGDMGSGTGGLGGSDMGGSPNDAGFDAPQEARVIDCHTNRECTDRATAAALSRAAEAGSDADAGPVGTVPAICLQPD